MTAVANANESALSDTLTGILHQFGGAIDFWTVVCQARGQLGDPVVFIDRQWAALGEQIQRLRRLLSEGEPSESALEQVAKLAKVNGEMREIFDYFLNADRVAQPDLESAVLKLAQVWQDVRMRVWLLGALIPLPQPPSLSLEKEAYYQAILDGLFDQLLTGRVTGDLSAE